MYALNCSSIRGWFGQGTGLRITLVPILAFPLLTGCSGLFGKHYDPGIELPRGEGVELVEAACTRCHDLRGLEAYKGYWNRNRWSTMVDTMVRNGARLDEDEKVVVTDYLTRYFGPGTRN